MFETLYGNMPRKYVFCSKTYRRSKDTEETTLFYPSAYSLRPDIEFLLHDTGAIRVYGLYLFEYHYYTTHGDQPYSQNRFYPEHNTIYNLIFKSYEHASNQI